LLQVELAPLPWYASKHGPSGCAKAYVVVTNDELRSSQAAVFQAFQEGFPMDFMLT
jgi:hypothetical protein